jgi:hypothetical protein
MGGAALDRPPFSTAVAGKRNKKNKLQKQSGAAV